MASSAEQLHLERLNEAPETLSGKRLYIDLDRCAALRCGECEAGCAYFYHPENRGLASLAELAAYSVVCRRCEKPHCVNACPHDALEQQKDSGKLLVRHTFRCVSCRSCSHACPYGTIYPELVPLLNHNCDFCSERQGEGLEPLCVTTCPHGALRLESVAVLSGDHTFLVGDHLIVHCTHWDRAEA